MSLLPYYLLNVESYILDYLNIDSLRNLSQVNIYYYILIKNKIYYFYNFFNDYLIKKKFEDILMHIKYNMDCCKNNIFDISVTYGHLDICKYIYNNEINGTYYLPGDHHNGLKQSCIYGYLDITIWLYDIYILKGLKLPLYEIETYFELAAMNNNIKTVEWIYINFLKNRNYTISKDLINYCVKYPSMLIYLKSICIY